MDHYLSIADLSPAEQATVALSIVADACDAVAAG